jgi:hypothetical protein
VIFARKFWNRLIFSPDFLGQLPGLGQLGGNVQPGALEKWHELYLLHNLALRAFAMRCLAWPI